MTPDRPLESLLCREIQMANFDASRTQVVEGNKVVDDLTLPRIVVTANSQPDPVLAQAGVYPVTVRATISLNAMDGSDNYMLDPLSEAAEDTLRNAASILDTIVLIHGATLGDIETEQSDDRLTRTISATVFASLK
jgi:hypothetical protein